MGKVNVADSCTQEPLLRETLDALGEFSEAVPDTISSRYSDARQTINELATLGIDLLDVAETLEREGLASFVQSWDDLIASVEDQLKNAGAEVMPAGAVKPASGDGASTGTPAAAAPEETATSVRQQ
ncbi:hypothetical protein QCD71_20830 [Sphingomonas sp. PsM26]|jgi:transaldolase|nr:hypothetical protein [Sphingomonas sp. PsM26]